MIFPDLKGLPLHRVLIRTVNEFIADEMSTYASALAYQMLFSLFPFLLFLIAHVYLITTGHTVGAHLKAMITGWEEVDDEPARYDLQCHHRPLDPEPGQYRRSRAIAVAANRQSRCDARGGLAHVGLGPERVPLRPIPRGGRGRGGPLPVEHRQRGQDHQPVLRRGRDARRGL